MNFMTKMKIWLIGGGAIAVMSGLIMLTDEVWGGHMCHTVRKEIIE